MVLQTTDGRDSYVVRAFPRADAALAEEAAEPGGWPHERTRYGAGSTSAR